MSGALIVIEIAAPKVSDAALAVLVSSCTRAARGAECVLAKGDSEEPPVAVAIVSLQTEDRMRVEVGVREGDHDSWRTKEFAFLAADETMDRWRAVGFAIGTLAESNLPPQPEPAPAPEPPPAPAPASTPAPVIPQPISVPPTSGLRLFLGAAGLVGGPGLDGKPRFGGALALHFGAAHSPLYFALGGSLAGSSLGASVVSAQRADLSSISARWYDVSLGPGIALLGPLTHTGLELGVSLVAENFGVNVKSANPGLASESRWLFGGEATLGGRLEVVPDFFLTADFRAAQLPSAQINLSGNPEIGLPVPHFRYLGGFGLRVRLR